MVSKQLKKPGVDWGYRMWEYENETRGYCNDGIYFKDNMEVLMVWSYSPAPSLYRVGRGKEGEVSLMW